MDGRCLISSGDQELFSFPQNEDRLWDPLNFIYNRPKLPSPNLRSSTSNPEVKSAWHYTYSRPYIFMLCLIKHRSNFVLLERYMQYLWLSGLLVIPIWVVQGLALGAIFSFPCHSVETGALVALSNAFPLHSFFLYPDCHA